MLDVFYMTDEQIARWLWEAEFIMAEDPLSPRIEANRQQLIAEQKRRQDERIHL